MQEQQSSLMMDLLCDIVFMTDVVLQFFLAYRESNRFVARLGTSPSQEVFLSVRDI